MAKPEVTSETPTITTNNDGAGDDKDDDDDDWGDFKDSASSPAANSSSVTDTKPTATLEHDADDFADFGDG